MDARRLFGYFFLFVGATLLLVGAFHAVGTLSFLADARSTEGTVVDYELVEGAGPPFVGGDAGILYYPVVTFDTFAGQRVRFSSPAGRNARVYDIDARVSVLYDPEKSQQRSRLDTFHGLWGRTSVFAGLGGIFIVLGLLAPHGFGGGRRGNPFA